MAKEYFVVVDGEEVPVSEEVYRAFKRPLWTERKRHLVRAEHERSLEQLAEDGFDVPDEHAPVDEIVEDKLMLEMLMAALAELTDDERSLINALYFEEKSEREVAAETGAPQTTINYRKNKILKWLREKLS